MRTLFKKRGEMEYRRDIVREELFNSSYHIRPEIFIKYELNPDESFRNFTIQFKLGDRVWVLEENYKDSTNLTDYCTLTGVDEKFKRFVDAELKLFSLMKEK